MVMSDHVYRVIEVVGSSPDGVDAAIANAVARAGETVRNLEWFEMVSVRGHIVDGAIAHTQVTVKIGFRIDPPD
ncbi:hypothetical protein FMUAM8_26930 [Nocardia cyriacigeorgica]|uniref:Dodecin domain-containing protein n=2 Tax=Nocardia cyriacigeorgica TaxID=135487 RepID=H6R4M0_NOCCG|nr:hypothetical protein FMUAM8_26930 [Nocardia cyriacigeorgica]BDU06421.1 hypothetical protein FMUBM48_26840 [Nocardia cyriacigeorgica]CCF63286.1 conserved protein of unknown function [Nocardia cyriacigeorgica GUH-2]